MTLTQPWEINVCSPPFTEVRREPGGDNALAMWVTRSWAAAEVFCLPLFTCYCILIFKTINIVYMNLVFQVVLDNNIG